MNKQIFKITTMIIAASMCLTNISIVKADSSDSNTNVIKKIAGVKPIEISENVCDAGWKQSDNVIVASPADFPDALSGTVIGIQLNAPILFEDGSHLTLTTADGFSCDGPTLDQLKRLGAKNVYILGGESSISSTIENTIKNRGYNVIRLSGKDRFETAAVVGQEVIKNSKSDTAFVCNAYGFADALSGSTFAGKSGSPILLTNGETLNEKSKKALTDWNIKNVYILGGQGVISSNVENEISSIGISVNRISGTDRYATSKAIIDKFSSSSQSLTLATGKDYHNALIASVYASKENAPLMLFDNDCDSTIKEFLKNKSLIAVGNDAIDLDSYYGYEYPDLPDINVPNTHEVKYHTPYNGIVNHSDVQNFMTAIYGRCQMSGNDTFEMAYWDLTTGEYSGVNIDNRVVNYTNPILLIDLFLYDQRSKGLINDSDPIEYKGTTRTVAELQKLATLNDDLDAYKALNKFCGTKKSVYAFVKNVVGTGNIRDGLTARENILIAKRVLAFIQTDTPLAKEFKSLLQDSKTGDVMVNSNLSGTKLMHRAYFNSAVGSGDTIIVTGDHPFVMFVQINVTNTSDDSDLSRMVSAVNDHINGK